jgi:hypothetical protein
MPSKLPLIVSIENAHYFMAEMAQLEIGSVSLFTNKAESVYAENLNAYVIMVLRRPFAKLVVRVFRSSRATSSPN